MNAIRAQFASYCAHVRAHPIKHGSIYGLTIGAMILSRSERQLRVFPFAPVYVVEQPYTDDPLFERERHATLISFKSPSEHAQEQVAILKGAAKKVMYASGPPSGMRLHKQVTLRGWSSWLDYAADQGARGDLSNVKVVARCVDVDGKRFYGLRVDKDDIGEVSKIAEAEAVMPSDK